MWECGGDDLPVRLTPLNSAGLTPTWTAFLFGNRDGSFSVKLEPPLPFLLPFVLFPHPPLTIFLVFIFFGPTHLCSPTATTFQPQCHKPVTLVLCSPDCLPPVFQIPNHSPGIKLLACSKTLYSLTLKLSVSSSQKCFCMVFKAI